MSDAPPHAAQQFHLRKVRTEAGQLCAIAESMRAGLLECCAESLRLREGTPRSEFTLRPRCETTPSLVDRLSEEIGTSPRDADDVLAIRAFLGQLRAFSAQADEVAYGIFASGLLCDHGRNVLYRLRSRRFDECGLELEDLKALTARLSLLEQQVAVLLFALRTGRSFREALRTIHPRKVDSDPRSAERSA